MSEKIECARTRKCGWKGEAEDLDYKPHRKKKMRDMGVTEGTCPRCGCHEHLIAD